MEEELNDLTFAEYVQLEKNSRIRHEYIAGQLFEMDEVSQEHDLICANLMSQLHTHLRERSDRVLMSDTILWIEVADVAYYPDVMVVCDPEERSRNFQTQPCLIIEVLSASTEATDRQEKWFAYQKLKSLQEYVLVSQADFKIEVYRQDSLGNWSAITSGKTDTIELKSVGVTLTIEQLYENIFDY